MEILLLQYAEWSMNAIKKFHLQYGALRIELKPSRGKLLRALLDRRSLLETDFAVRAGNPRLIWGYGVFTFYQCLAYLLHRRLLFLYQYVKEADAAHGYEITQEGNYQFFLVPIAKRVWKNETPVRWKPES